jgi:hypothetical protein
VIGWAHRRAPFLQLERSQRLANSVRPVSPCPRRGDGHVFQGRSGAIACPAEISAKDKDLPRHGAVCFCEGGEIVGMGSHGDPLGILNAPRAAGSSDFQRADFPPAGCKSVPK